MEKSQSLQRKVVQYEDDQKEREIELQGLREEVKRLKLKCLDPSKYEDWGPEEICEWILGLGNGKLAKYEKVLRENLKEEEVVGSMLGDVDGGDLKGWGISKFADKQFLKTEIAILVGKQPAALASSSSAMANEGAKAITSYI